ncbi:putative phage tail protein [Klebsiella oxytoca]|uniref:Putative phage tail protein n=1 Tax=Klebsiella oxytoca TaxID=571 RepID=A0A318G3R9_KLEOX|nr:tail assembly protein [Klebsiella oxytoca]PXW46363.1 putative phage tail protein [Klebsiella oxytoca]
MQECMVRIELGGILGKRFGKSHFRMVATTSEAIRALCCTINGFEKFMNNSKAMGFTYAVFKGKENIREDEVPFPINDNVVRIVPVVIGSKKAGVLQTILGVALIAIASIATMGAGGILAAMAAGSGWGSVAMLGASMALGGVLQMLSPQVPGLASQQSPENKASYAFGGVTNTTAQGYPVPLLYGKRRIGGAIITAGIYVEDQQ